MTNQKDMKRNGNIGYFHHAISKNPSCLSWNDYREKVRHLQSNPHTGYFTFLEHKRNIKYRSMRFKNSTTTNMRMSRRSRKREHFSSLNWFVAAYEQKIYTKLSESNIPDESNVVLVTCPRTKKVFALKVTRKTRFKREREVEIHSKIGIHPNILRLLDSFETFDRCYLLFNAQSGDLRSLMFRKRRFKEIETVRVMLQLLRALNYVHTNHSIVHGDVKPENILIRGGETELNVLLCDFGNAFQHGEGSFRSRSLSSSSCESIESTSFFMCEGSYEYAAPEVMLGLKNLSRDFPIDLWSVGICAYEMIAGFEPFYPYSTAIKEDPVFPPHYWSETSTQCQHFVQNLLSRDPKKRATTREALQSLWLKEHTRIF